MCIRDSEYPVRAFRLGGPVELARLLDYIPDSNGEQQRLEAVSYTHLDVYKRQLQATIDTLQGQLEVKDRQIEQQAQTITRLTDCLLYTSRCV